jgi:hypothetical protein
VQQGATIQYYDLFDAFQVPCMVSDKKVTCRILGYHSGGYEEYYRLGYNAVSSVESRPVFRINISPPSSGSKNKPSKKPA